MGATEHVRRLSHANGEWHIVEIDAPALGTQCRIACQNKAEAEKIETHIRQCLAEAEAAARADERERCAKVAEEPPWKLRDQNYGTVLRTARYIAAAIRRGEGE